MGNIIEVLRGLGVARLVTMGLVAAGLIAFFAFIAARVTSPSLALLYGNLDIRDSGQIVSKLEAMKVPYELSGNGAQILVPEDQVLRLRMTMAEAGLPSGGSIGYEIFDRSEALGTTSFVQNINHLRALEGELARTIRSLEDVQSARVHLVLPKREVFSRESRDPSASIVLRTRSNRIDAAQVRAIQNLVAAAVPDLKPSRVSIVDDHGNLLASGAGEQDAEARTAATLVQLRLQHEQRLKRAVESLLERSVGIGNVRSEVSVEMDFDRVTTNSETFDPDSQVVRSTQVVEEENQSSEGTQNVTVANNLPENDGASSGDQSQTRNQRNEETINYEISKIVKTQVREAGIIRRISVAVLVNGIRGTDAQGNPTYQPRSEEQLQQLAALTRSAIGYDEARGDTVEVVNLRFAEPEQLAETESAPAPLFGLNKNDLFQIAEILGLAILSILVLLLVVRPLIARLLATQFPTPVIANLPANEPAPAIAGPAPAVPTAVPAAEPALAQAGPAIEHMIDIARVEGQVKASSMKKIGEIIDKHPEEAVAIVRHWLYEDR